MDYDYHDERVCATLLPRAHITNQLSKFTVHVACGRGSFLFWRRCKKLCTSGLWMTSHLPIIGHARTTRESVYLKWLTAGQHWTGGKVWCLRLPCFQRVRSRCFDLPRHIWSLINRFWTGQGPNGVSPNHLPVIVASDRPWTISSTRAH